MVRIAYIILLICSAVFYPLYEDKLSFITLVTMLILPVLLLIQGIYSSARLKLLGTGSDSTVFKGTEGDVTIQLSNPSIFPMSNTKVRVKIVFEPIGAVRYVCANVPLPAKSSQTITVNIDAEHCGAAKISLEYVKAHDLLGLFSFKKFRKYGLCGTLYIIPQVSEKYVEEAEALLSRAAELTESESDTAVSSSSDATGDVNGFREFAPGDRLSRMHYKLSARFDKDMVKLYSAETTAKYLLSADLSVSMGLESRDAVLERLMTCAYFLYKGNAEVYAAVPLDSQLKTEKLSGGAAAPYDSDDSYAEIAAALVGADFIGTRTGKGYICCEFAPEPVSAE